MRDCGLEIIFTGARTWPGVVHDAGVEKDKAVGLSRRWIGGVSRRPEKRQGCDDISAGAQRGSGWKGGQGGVVIRREGLRGLELVEVGGIGRFADIGFALRETAVCLLEVDTDSDGVGDIALNT